MFTAPFRAILKASRKGSLGNLNPTPWAFTLGNCCGWMIYSFITYNLWLFFGNAPGFCLSIWFNMEALKLEYENFRSEEKKRSIIVALEEQTMLLKSQALGFDHSNGDTSTSNNGQEGAVEAPSPPTTRPTGYVKNAWDTTQRTGELALDYAKIVGGVVSQNTKAPYGHEFLVLANVVVWVIIVSIIIFARSFTNETRQFIVGIAGNVNLVFFFGAPLSTIGSVLKTRSSASIHRWTMIANTFNGFVWAIFGFSIVDYFIAVPNAIGAFLGTVQIILCVIFPRPRKNKNNKNINLEGDGGGDGGSVDNEDGDDDDGKKSSSEVASIISKSESGSVAACIIDSFKDEIDDAVIKRRNQLDNNSQDTPTSTTTSSMDKFWFL